MRHPTGQTDIDRSLPSPPHSAQINQNALPTNLNTSPNVSQALESFESRAEYKESPRYSECEERKDSPGHIPQPETTVGLKRKLSSDKSFYRERSQRQRCREHRRKSVTRKSECNDCSKTTLSETEEKDPISYWAESGEWPQYFANMSQDRSDSSNKRRRSETLGYSRGVREGKNPPAHSPAYETVLERYGIMFNDLDTREELSVESKEMCKTLLDAGNYGQAYFSLSESKFLKVWQRARKGNEERVRRDLTPLIVPSAELLYLVDGEDGLEHVAEEISVEWGKCENLGGTIPKPDLAVGLSHTMFSEEEKAKLQNHTSFASPTKVTDALFFPFLVCEAKCGRRNVNDADRQNIHSASIAVNAIVQLYRAVDTDMAKTLSGQILVFSVSHDNERVKIYGHFPLIRNGKITFHRYYVDDYSLDSHYGRDRDKGSNFTRAVYRIFYPRHVQRIRDALTKLDDPITRLVMSEISIDDDNSQASGPSSQESSRFARPTLRRAQSQSELTVMKQQMAKVEAIYKSQVELQQKEMEQMRQVHKEQLERQQKMYDEQLVLLRQLAGDKIAST
ncbi:Hypothetical protein R9X50_00177500 [Acrodontium crateriforme]|uniref:DUF7924 domain-containing protein n=1 Tax=Acrodontium crateriforme TaxID=150365 RepID=A0AAQ3M018_9PEZI|nr:Hypothetical protein R9X50_00177500 [Acrodontium crateriforme]